MTRTPSRPPGLAREHAPLGEAADAHGPRVEIRDIRSHDEFVACVRLQEETWGEGFSERVPAAILKVTQRVGGITAGAFDDTGRLLGFVFGITGVEGGELVHWSDMLAVRPEARDHGLGRRLKMYQRDRLLGLGVKRIYWTFDPLVARNAHFNLNRLGARAVEYVVDMYGAETDSPLHRGLGTDRFIIAWHLTADDPAADEGRGNPGRRFPGAEDAPILNAVTEGGGNAAGVAWPLLRVEVPPDIGAIQATSLEQAARWRAATRGAFLHALGRGYQVAGFYRDADTGRCFYVLSGTEASRP